ncbi:MAG: hypothetical protein CMK49_03185 [Prochlorococcus sp. SP3034]|nr:hypothetical protein [Prochlorococcus sp. SP3034]|tara:strand:+ start:866 stop:1162 length:297 start_codon:yes stop_codon:yes gene_type:complete
MNDDQIHPLHDTDKEIVDSLIVKISPEDFDLINLARLINRYEGFQGEHELKDDLKKILKFWKMSKDELFSKTRKIWKNSFRPSNTSKEMIGSGFDASN